MSTDNSLITFKAIANFTNDLASVFGEIHRPLKLYDHLITKTTIAHDKPILKHIEAFREFCVSNREAISEKNINNLTFRKIFYSKRVFIDMGFIFQKSDPETTNVIWKHLLTISALVDPTGKAREILKEETKNGYVGEANFLTDIISKVESQVDPNANPMEAVASIMKSGIFTDLVNGMGSGLQDGTLDLNKLMSTVQTMVTKLSDDSGDSAGGKQAVDMITTMMGSINAGAGSVQNNDNTQQPDLAAMLGPMLGSIMGQGGSNDGMPNIASMLSGLSGLSGNSNNSIEDQIDKQVSNAKASGKFKPRNKKD